MEKQVEPRNWEALKKAAQNFEGEYMPIWPSRILALLSDLSRKEEENQKLWRRIMQLELGDRNHIRRDGPTQNRRR